MAIFLVNFNGISSFGEKVVSKPDELKLSKEEIQQLIDDQVISGEELV